MKVRLFLLAPLVVLLPSCGLFGGGGVKRGSIDGFVFTTVETKSGQPSRLAPPEGYTAVEGALVQVEGTKISSLTDASGYFLLEGVPVGERTLVVSKEGFLPVRVTVTVQESQIVRAHSEGADFIVLPRATRVWTVMVYMGADNDMDEVALDDLNEMEKAGSTDNFTVVVQLDRRGGGAKRYLVVKDDDPTKVGSQLLEDLGEVNMGDPQTLADFVRWGVETYPAQHYMLVLWNHGTGWVPRVVRPRPRAIVYDDTDNDQLSTPELREALSRAGAFVDILGFDACLMQMTEIAYEVRGYARYMVASEENEPWEGWPYDRVLSNLVSNPTMTPLELAKAIVDEYIAYVDSTGWTLSVADLSRMDEVGKALDKLAKALADAWSQQKEDILLAIEQTQRFDIVGIFGGQYSDYRDLAHFAYLLTEGVGDPAVKGAASSLLDALSGAVPYSRYKGDAVKDAQGLSIYLPDSFTTPLEKRTKLNQYRSLPLAQDTYWDEFLALIPVGG
ncbi:MAG TPA: hypothetical protein EYP65_01490 [Armatimonadetes bacterium]|nr:hypothetical protein [Armatimonadota bacterium]